MLLVFGSLAVSSVFLLIKQCVQQRRVFAPHYVCIALERSVNACASCWRHLCFRRLCCNGPHAVVELGCMQIQGMRLQQEIMAKVQLAYKTGDRKEAERLLARLKPEEP